MEYKEGDTLIQLYELERLGEGKVGHKPILLFYLKEAGGRGKGRKRKEGRGRKGKCNESDGRRRKMIQHGTSKALHHCPVCDGIEVYLDDNTKQLTARYVEGAMYCDCPTETIPFLYLTNRLN